MSVSLQNIMDYTFSLSSINRPQCPGVLQIRHPYINVLILCVINVINYTDRYTLGGIISPIQEQFGIRNDLSGILQSSFTFTYMTFAPILGFFGDRYPRKVLLIICIALWTCAHLGGSFATHYVMLVISRILLGIGQAGFASIAPTVISDLFTGDRRARMLGFFYLAIPVGNGLSIVVSAEMYKATHEWQWSLRVTPLITVIFIILLLFMREPPRGVLERHVMSSSDNRVRPSLCSDLRKLIRTKTYVATTFAFTFLAFTTGVFYYWGPELYHIARILVNPNENKAKTVFGIISIFSGVLGLCLGYISSHFLKSNFPRIDPIICGVGLILAAPMLIASTFTNSSEFVMYLLLFLAEVAMNLNWAILVDIMFEVVQPNMRALACGLQMLVGHSLGDTVSPYIMGLMTDALEDKMKTQWTNRSEIRFNALKYSYFFPCSCLFVGGALFFVSACYIVEEAVNLRSSAVSSRNTSERNVNT